MRPLIAQIPRRRDRSTYRSAFRTSFPDLLPSRSFSQKQQTFRTRGCADFRRDL